MELDSRDFRSCSPVKTVRFGGSVAETLDKHSRGNSSDYELLKHQLSDPDIKDSQIIVWLQEFRSCVTQLNKDHEQLVHTLLNLPWSSRSAAVLDEFLSFLGNLVSAQTVHLQACLRMVASQFTPRRVVVCEGGVDVSDSDDEDENLPRVFERSHQALQLILRYVPSTSLFLMPILQDAFPFIHKSSRALECYVHNLLRVCVYVPKIRRDVLELLLGKMLTLDVSASRADIEEEEEKALQRREEDEAEQGLFHMDEDLSSSPGQSSSFMSHPAAEKLDSLMLVLMSFIKDFCHQDGALHAERTKDLYKDLLVVFDRLLLPTHASSHVQFSLFFLCSFRLALSEAFLDHQWKILQNPSQPVVLRQAAASYLGSFLARANFLPVGTIRACLDLLLSWIHAYIDSSSLSGGLQQVCDVGQHGAFYSACQAAFYTVVFRHTLLLRGNMKTGLEYLQSLNLDRVVMCHLNPLRVCLPSVCSLFAAVTRKYQLVFCYSVLERNNRLKLPVIRSSTGGETLLSALNPLDCFFPFDPYLLKRSGRLIEPLYQQWEEVADSDLLPTTTRGQQESRDEEDDDFLQGETPQGDGVVAMTPRSFDSTVGSPASLDTH